MTTRGNATPSRTLEALPMHRITRSRSKDPGFTTINSSATARWRVEKNSRAMEGLRSGQDDEEVVKEDMNVLEENSAEDEDSVESGSGMNSSFVFRSPIFIICRLLTSDGLHG